MRKLWLATAIGALTACTTVDPGECGFPEEPMQAEGTLDADDTCLYWELSVDEHLIVNVAVALEEEQSFPGCTYNETEYVALNSAPIYSNLEGQGAKWTFDWVATTPSDGLWDEIEVTCDDGTVWTGRVGVVE